MSDNRDQYGEHYWMEVGGNIIEIETCETGDGNLGLDVPIDAKTCGREE